MSSAADKPETTRGVFVQKQTSSVYTALLFLSLVAIIIGCVFLAMEMKAYDWDMKAAGAKPAAFSQQVIDVTSGWAASLRS